MPQPILIHAFTVTPSDTVDFLRPCHRLYVGGAGDIAAVMATGAVVTFKAVPVGTQLGGVFKRVNATNTTATLMVGLGPY